MYNLMIQLLLNYFELLHASQLAPPPMWLDKVYVSLQVPMPFILSTTHQLLHKVKIHLMYFSSV